MKATLVPTNCAVWDTVWNKKLAILLGCLCVVVIIHVLLDSFFNREDSPGANPEDFFRYGGDVNNLMNSDSKKKVIVLSYMRSGSTLAGDIIQSHPSVFYVYEPLLYLWDYYVPKKMNVALNLWKRTKTFWKTSKHPLVPPLDFMTSMFNCNLTTDNLKFLTNAAHSQDFQSTKCPIHRNGMNMVDSSQTCADILTARCRRASTVLLKVVRLSMVEADRYLDGDPDVRVLHLVRDPRGILLSRMNFNDKETGEMHNNYSNICRRILDDVVVSQAISYKYKGRLLTVRYEDLAQNLMGFTRKIFDFVGLSVGPEVLQHLKEMTNSKDTLSNKKIRAKKTKRKNPYRTAYKWRSLLPFSLVKKVDYTCEKLYKIMGYRPFATEANLRNFAVSARSRYYGDGLLTTIM